MFPAPLLEHSIRLLVHIKKILLEKIVAFPLPLISQILDLPLKRNSLPLCMYMIMYYVTVHGCQNEKYYN